MMDRLRMGALRLDIRLSPVQLDQFETYYRELLDWNQRMNLTAITDYEEVQIKHFLDSLSVVLAMPKPVPVGLMVVDVGTGAGLPGIPLKIALPEISLTLVDATNKKAEFLRHLVERLMLSGVAVVVGRAETLAHEPQYRERFDLALSRAVAPLPAAAELALPFVANGGSFVAQKKGDISQEIEAAAPAIEKLGGKLRESMPVNLPDLSDDRSLVIIDKVSPTPEKYPRRPGIPEKRPLK